MRVSHFRSYTEIPSDAKVALAERTYPAIFNEAPWAELWTPEAVQEKLRRDLTPPCGITIVLGDEADSIEGFSWWAVIPKEKIPARVRIARHLKEVGVDHVFEQLLPQIETELVVYVDELAVTPRSRGKRMTMHLIIQLARVASEQKIGVFCWSRPESKVVSILQNHGFRVVGTLGKVLLLYLTAAGADKWRWEMEAALAVAEGKPEAA